MCEPPLNWPHFNDRGWYFVRYPDGQVSYLMSRRTCKEYAKIFGGTAHRHSMAPKVLRRLVWAVLITLVCFVIVALGGIFL